MEDLLNLTSSTSFPLLLLLLLLLLPFIFIFFFKSIFSNSIKPCNNLAPKSYPLIGSLPSILRNKHRFIQWTSDVVNHAPTKTAVLRRPLGRLRVVTANPAVVRHVLKTSFHRYPKGESSRANAVDLLGDGIFNVDGDTWKLQRQVSSHEFNTRSLRNFVEQVVDNELNHRLIPILTTAAATTTTTGTTTTTTTGTTGSTGSTNGTTGAIGTTTSTTGTTGTTTGDTGATTGATVLDLQDILQRFAFDNICQIAFGYDPAYLLPSLPEAVFATAFEEAVMITTGRIRSNLPAIWKLKRLLNVGSEKRLRSAVAVVREFATRITKQKKSELDRTRNSSIKKPEPLDLLSRFLISGHSDEDFVADIVISFILAGRDTTSAALTWFFWLISRNPRIENEILKEIRSKPEDLAYDDVKSMVYTHACLCESMRLFPPVAVDGKQAAEDDVLPDGTFVKRGDPVSYHIYAMGRSEEIWGPDWAEFRPERWLDKDTNTNTNTDTDTDTGSFGGWVFKGRDIYEYPVFQAGPRVCLGKEMAFLQMKRVVAGVLRRFRVVPVVDEGGGEPEYVVYFTAKMKGGFPVRIEKRDEIE